MDPLLLLAEYDWGKSLNKLSSFNMGTYFRYVGKEGSQRLYKEGYNLFVSSYLKEVWTAEKSNDIVLVKARCYARMRKNEAPRHLFCEINIKDEVSITSSFCSCKAGQGKCIHLAALIHQLNHWILMGHHEVPEATTCTSIEQKWHKPRGDKIEADPLMETIFARPNINRKKDPLTCSFTTLEGRIPPSSEEISQMAKRIKEENADFPLAYLLTPSSGPNRDVQDMVKVPIGEVPVGSTLAHQLKSFNPTMCFSEVKKSVTYPALPMVILEVPEGFTMNVTIPNDTNITLPDAIDLEGKTRGQNTDLWHNARKVRLTASRFGSICKRKKAVNIAFLNLLYQGPNLDKVKSVAYGKKCEAIARVAYVKYMHSIGKPIIEFSAGFVVNPGIPFLGCSPDGKIYDPNESPEFGLLEIKCPITKRNMSLVEACDGKFCCSAINGNIHLKESSDYYFQVQGQLLICGVEWCDFVVFNGKDVWTERIRKDDTFCDVMLLQLCQFYRDHFLQHLKSVNS